MINDYLYAFIQGGLLVSGIKYISDNYGGSYGAAFGGIPISICAIYYIKNLEIMDDYIYNYVIMTCILLLTSIFMFYLRSIKVNRTYTIIYTVLFWAMLTLLKLYFNVLF